MAETKTRCAWLYPPKSKFTPLYFIFNQRGSENFMTYIWIIKDLSWMQALGGWYYSGFLFGGLAMLWSVVLSMKALFITKNYHEAYLYIGQAMWLAGNYCWMSGELYSDNFVDDDALVLYADRTIIAGNILLAAFLYLLVFFLILKPFNVIPKASEESRLLYDTPGLLKGRMKLIFKSWREYENIHLLFWCGKDLSWNTSQPITYWIFAVLTLIESIHFTYTSFFHPEMIIDHSHFIAIFLWVLANIVWASGEFYLKLDDPYPLFPDLSSTDAFITSRWWASWLLICALVPVVALYMLWWKSCKCSCGYYINDEEHYNNDDENRVTVLEEKYNQIQSPGGQGGQTISDINLETNQKQ